MCREPSPAPAGQHLHPVLMGCPIRWAFVGAGAVGMAECAGAGLSCLEHPCLSPCSPEQHSAGLAARAAGELGRARLCPSSCQSASVLWLCLCPGNHL